MLSYLTLQACTELEVQQWLVVIGKIFRTQKNAITNDTMCVNQQSVKLARMSIRLIAEMDCSCMMYLCMFVSHTHTHTHTHDCEQTIGYTRSKG